MARLYELTSTYASLIAAIENGEIPEEAVADTLEAVEGEYEEKCDNVISAIKNLQAEAEAIKAEADKLIERQKAKIRQVENLIAYLTESMNRVGKTKHESAKHLVTFRASKALEIDDVDAYLAWAKEHAPETVKTTVTEKPIAAEIRNLLDKTEVPHVHIAVRQNIQIK